MSWSSIYVKFCVSNKSKYKQVKKLPNNRTFLFQTHNKHYMCMPFARILLYNIWLYIYFDFYENSWASTEPKWKNKTSHWYNKKRYMDMFVSQITYLFYFFHIFIYILLDSYFVFFCSSSIFIKTIFFHL